ncbi:hypothetical protein BGZ80_007077, partial [Entomortierella chlamydospora]
MTVAIATRRTQQPLTATNNPESHSALSDTETLKGALQRREDLDNASPVIGINHIGHDQHLPLQIQEEQQEQQRRSQCHKTFESMDQETGHLQYPSLSPNSPITMPDKSNPNLCRNSVDPAKKGTRLSLSLQRKLEIITKATQDYIESKSESRAPSMIKRNRRMVDSRSPIVEKLLVNWLKHLKIRGTVVSDKKICAQAIEIHRLLSSFQRDRLSPCQFTTGWLKGFRNRYGVSMELKSDYPSMSYFSNWATKVIEWNLNKYGTDDIYTCGLTSMFLSVMPASNLKDEGDKLVSNDTDYSSAT